eukprot:3724073-Prymnesium_polylepis.1
MEDFALRRARDPGPLPARRARVVGLRDQSRHLGRRLGLLGRPRPTCLGGAEGLHGARLFEATARRRQQLVPQPQASAPPRWGWAQHRAWGCGRSSPMELGHAGGLGHALPQAGPPKIHQSM